MQNNFLRYVFIFTLVLLILSSCGQETLEPTHEHTFAETEDSPTKEGPVPTPTLENWSNVSTMPLPNFEANAVALDGYIYVSGGITAKRSLKNLYRFDPKTNTWEELAPMPDFRNHHGMVVMDGKIYVAGGMIGETSFDGQAKTFWVYDPQTNEWTVLAEMPFGRTAGGIAEIDGKLYVTGGMSPRGNDPTELWVYDPVTNSWDDSLAHLPTQRDHVIVVSYAKKLYVIGGRYSTNLATVEIYDPVTDSWSQGADMPTGRSGMAFAIIHDQLHAIAGEDVDGGRVYMKHEVFDFASQTWFSLHDIPRPLNAPSAAVVDGYIYLMGGGSLPGNPYKDVWQFTP